jgi:hypothetical protein
MFVALSSSSLHQPLLCLRGDLLRSMANTRTHRSRSLHYIIMLDAVSSFLSIALVVPATPCHTDQETLQEEDEASRTSSVCIVPVGKSTSATVSGFSANHLD